MNTTPNTPHPARRPEPRSAVAEIARVLEPGATFCGTTFLSPKVPFGDDGTQQAVDAALRELASAVAGRVGGPRGKAAALAPASCAAQCAHTCELRSSLPLPRGTLYPVCVVLGIYILKGSEFMECFGGTLLMLTLIVLMHAMDVECLAPTLPEVEVYAILSTPEVVTVRRPVVDSPRCHPLHSRSLQRYLLGAIDPVMHMSRVGERSARHTRMLALRPYSQGSGSGTRATSRSCAPSAGWWTLPRTCEAGSCSIRPRSPRRTTDWRRRVLDFFPFTFSKKTQTTR